MFNINDYKFDEEHNYLEDRWGGDDISLSPLHYKSTTDDFRC
jgi:hypothetical protein